MTDDGHESNPRSRAIPRKRIRERVREREREGARGRDRDLATRMSSGQPGPRCRRANTGAYTYTRGAALQHAFVDIHRRGSGQRRHIYVGSRRLASTTCR